MPELPEVEEVRRTLEPFIVGVKVVGARVVREDFVTVQGEGGKGMQGLVGKRFVKTWRHGKKLFCVAEDAQTLVIHLGMSGRVDCLPGAAAVAKHTHVVMSMESGIEVRLRDPRRFGGLWYYATLAEARAVELAGLGKDALEIEVGDLLERWKGEKGKLKPRLLSQKDVAGLGNIYVDEALWLARLHPLQRVGRISAGQVEVLVGAIGKVLRESIEMGGTTLRDYRNAADEAGEFGRKLQAYGRGGQPCLRCGEELRSAVIGGRTTVFCPRCQKRK